MQILPQQLATSDSTENGTTVRQTVSAAKQTALFASLLSGMASSSSVSSSQGTDTISSASASTLGNPVVAANAPSQQDLMNLPLTREDIAALHDELSTRGFSETEISDMETSADSQQGMTWGELVSEVKKKVTTSESKKTDETSTTTSATTSTSDQSQLLGFFGKLGFTADESQQMVDSLSKGETESVWNKVQAKVASLSSDASVSLDSSEIAAFSRGLNLSETAQNRLTALFDQSNAAAGLSTQGLATAMGLIQNELTSQLAKENQSLEDFKQAAAPVLAQAWQKNSTKQGSDLHEDDVARKAAQAVSLGGGGKADGDDDGTTAKTIAKSEVDVTADLPKTAQTVHTDTVKNSTAQHDSASGKHAQDSQNSQKETTAAATVAEAESQTTATSEEQSKTTEGLTTTSAQETATKGQEKHLAASATTNGGTQLVGGTGGTATGGQSDQFNQSAKDGESGWGEFWSKVRADGLSTASATTASGLQGLGQASVSATNGGLAQFAKTAAQLSDSGLSSRAAQQLENGLLKDMGQGTKQLTLTLNPEELGNLSVTLTVKDKELRATITADNADTAAMLQEQASKIKEHLESQGLKVAKLDVQTSLSQDNQSGWQSPEQHNMAREQRETMDRLRTSMRLARSLDSGTSSEAESITVIPSAMTAQGAGLDLFT
jgi:flagellar hook-length control protein FliK